MKWLFKIGRQRGRIPKKWLNQKASGCTFEENLGSVEDQCNVYELNHDFSTEEIRQESESDIFIFEHLFCNEKYDGAPFTYGNGFQTTINQKLLLIFKIKTNAQNCFILHRPATKRLKTQHTGYLTTL